MPKRFQATIYGSDGIASIVDSHKRCAAGCQAALAGNSFAAAWIAISNSRSVLHETNSEYDNRIALIILCGPYVLEGQILAQSAAVFLRCDGRAPLGGWRGIAKEPAKYHHAVIIHFEGEIRPGLESYLFRKLDAAKQQGADLVILEIDSLGGRLKESLEIAERLQKLDWAHTVAYVPREAISGAAIVSLGCDEILMAPQARIGDAGVIFKGEDSFFRFVPQKSDQFSRPSPA